MTDYYDGQITDILPHNLTDDDAVKALSYAVREGTRLLYHYASQCYVYCSIDTMPDNILDLLAVELRTQYYSDDLDIETKRSLVANTLLWYTKAGTPEAVEELINVVFGEGVLLEWFEYDADPYWFKIAIDTKLGEGNLEYFSEMIQRVKNTRSHIGSIDTLRQAFLTEMCGLGGFSYIHACPIFEMVTADYEEETDVYTGVARQAAFYPAALTEGKDLDRTMQSESYAGVAGLEIFYPEPITEE